MDSFAAMSLLYVALVAIGLFVLVLWILLPFALFGIKPILREMLELLREQRAARLAGQGAEPPSDRVR